jgi:hypothetical protein
MFSAYKPFRDTATLDLLTRIYIGRLDLGCHRYGLQREETGVNEVLEGIREMHDRPLQLMPPTTRMVCLFRVAVTGRRLPVNRIDRVGDGGGCSPRSTTRSFNSSTWHGQNGQDLNARHLVAT